jgi:putative hydrolase of the HAD superfamily
MIETIGFDADDTLWHNEDLYHNAKESLTLFLADYGEPQEIISWLDETEVRNIEYYGYGIKSFTLSMIETATFISKGQVTGKEISEIISVAKKMLRSPVELFEGTEDMLNELSANYDLMLITKGDPFEQQRKIELSGITQYFRYVEVVGEKSEASYRKILGQYKLDPARFMMVGNSLRSDILPVLKIGGQAVYIPNALTWFHENASQEEVGEVEYAELERLSQLPRYLASFQQDKKFDGE